MKKASWQNPDVLINWVTGDRVIVVDPRHSLSMWGAGWRYDHDYELPNLEPDPLMVELQQWMNENRETLMKMADDGSLWELFDKLK